MRQKAILSLNNMLRERVKEQEALCRRYPQYAQEIRLPDVPLVAGGLLDDLKVLRYALQPNPDHSDPEQATRTLIDELASEIESAALPESTERNKQEEAKL